MKLTKSKLKQLIREALKESEAAEWAAAAKGFEGAAERAERDVSDADDDGDEADDDDTDAWLNDDDDADWIEDERPRPAARAVRRQRRPGQGAPAGTDPAALQRKVAGLEKQVNKLATWLQRMETRQR